MTGRDIYNRAVTLLGLLNSDVGYYEDIAVGCINQMLSDTLWQNNAIAQSKGLETLEQAQKIDTLEQEIVYDNEMVDECFAYGLAALLVAQEDHEEFNRMNYEYESRRQYYMPCCETEIRVVDT